MQQQARLPKSPDLTGLVVILLAPLALVVGVVTGESWVAGAALAGMLLALLSFVMVPSSTPVKVVFLLITVTFLQRAIGYFKLEQVRGLNAGNVLLALAFGYWVLNGIRTGRWYRKNPLDLTLLITAIVIPVFSIYKTLAFGNVPGYSVNTQLSWYKQWLTPFIYFFLLCQTLERRRDIRSLVVMVLGLVAVSILYALPDTLRFSSWHESRSAGFVDEANSYGALLSTTAPFVFLIAFLHRKRPVVRLLAMALLGGMAITLLTTYSRSGYVGFALALIGAVYVAYRTMGSFPIGVPALVITGVLFVPIVAAPNLVDYVKDRFTVKTYKRAKRKSYGRYSAIDKFSGDRLSIWKGAIGMARDHPVLGAGFHSFEDNLPRYHPRGVSNYAHNLFLGTLAEGGVIWLASLVVFLWQVLRFLYQNWKIVIAQKDVWGQVICGGGLICFGVMIWTSLTLDFLNPGPKTTVFWVLMAGAVTYCMLPPDETEASVRSPA